MWRYRWFFHRRFELLSFIRLCIFCLAWIRPIDSVVAMSLYIYMYVVCTMYAYWIISRLLQVKDTHMEWMWKCRRVLFYIATHNLMYVCSNHNAYVYVWCTCVYKTDSSRALSLASLFPSALYIHCCSLMYIEHWNIEWQRVGYSNAHTFSLCIAFCFPGFFPPHHIADLHKKYFAFDEKLLY